jgi:protein gp37
MFRQFERWDPKNGFEKANNPFRSSDNTFFAPLKIKDAAMVFTCSMSDFFIEEADTHFNKKGELIRWREDAWEIIRKTPHITYQILTKRPERIAQCLPTDWGDGYDNVWLGVSIEDHKTAFERLRPLLAVPAAIHFVSAEPLLGSIPFGRIEYGAIDPHYGKRTEVCDALGIDSDFKYGIDWVILGGESGNINGKYAARACHKEWLQRVVDDCKRANVAVFVKQLGSTLARAHKLKDTHGGNMDEWPQEFDSLRVREFPSIIKQSA